MNPGRRSAAQTRHPGSDKRHLRTLYKEQRRRELAQRQPQILERLLQLLNGWPSLARPGGIGLYWPLEGEVDLRPLVQKIPHERRRLALPAIWEGQLVYRPWQPGMPLHPDACGIPAPPPEAGQLTAGQLGLLLIPALAIDQQGIRLGYGAGWYDRLRSQAEWQQVPSVAVLPANCVCSVLPQDSWDVPLDGWVSEHGLTLATPARDTTYQQPLHGPGEQRTDLPGSDHN